jgi:cell division protein FtsL
LSNNHHATSKGFERNERGFLTFSGLLLFLVVAAILFVAYRLLPPYIDNYRLQDSMEDIARTATYTQRITEEEIRDQVIDEASQFGIPLRAEQVAVQRSGASVGISASYGVSVDLLVRQVDLQFSPAAGNRNIMAR